MKKVEILIVVLLIMTLAATFFVSLQEQNPRQLQLLEKSTNLLISANESLKAEQETLKRYNRLLNKNNKILSESNLILQAVIKDLDEHNAIALSIANKQLEADKQIKEVIDKLDMASESGNRQLQALNRKLDRVATDSSKTLDIVKEMNTAKEEKEEVRVSEPWVPREPLLW